MIKSMTGYGKAQGTVAGVPTTVEVRSVNGRYLELSVRLPKEWADQEQPVREVIRDGISRGSVSVFVRREDVQMSSAVSVNLDAARTYVDALRYLQQELSLTGTVGIEHLASYAPAFSGATEEKLEVWPELRALLLKAVEELNTMRNREGAALGADVVDRVRAIGSALDVVEQLSAARIPHERERLRERVRLIMADESVDEQRLQLEIVLLSERLDVSEECVRLRTHLAHVQEDLITGGTIGRKLNFLLQEINREVNTIGSKANDAEIARIVVGMKEEVERIREQVQNLE